MQGENMLLFTYQHELVDMYPSLCFNKCSQLPQSGDELSSRVPTSLPPQGLYALLSRARGDEARLCPPVRSSLHHNVGSLREF